MPDLCWGIYLVTFSGVFSLNYVFFHTRLIPILDIASFVLKNEGEYELNTFDFLFLVNNAFDFFFGLTMRLILKITNMLMGLKWYRRGFLFLWME